MFVKKFECTFLGLSCKVKQVSKVHFFHLIMIHGSNATGNGIYIIIKILAN